MLRVRHNLGSGDDNLGSGDENKLFTQIFS